MHVVRVLSSPLRFGQAGSGPVAAGGAERGRGGEARQRTAWCLPRTCSMLRKREGVEGEALGSKTRQAARQGRVPRVRTHLASDADGPGSSLPVPRPGRPFQAERGVFSDTSIADHITRVSPSSSQHCCRTVLETYKEDFTPAIRVLPWLQVPAHVPYG